MPIFEAPELKTLESKAAKRVLVEVALGQMPHSKAERGRRGRGIYFDRVISRSKIRENYMGDALKAAFEESRSDLPALATAYTGDDVTFTPQPPLKS